jgi:hypothetical protein
MTMKLAAAIAAMICALGVVACGGDDDDDGDATATRPPTSPTAARTSAASPGAGATAAPRSTPIARVTTEPGSITGFTQAQATALIEASLIKPEDLEGTWEVMSDNTVDNAAAAAADPSAAASIERCGRLLARTFVNRPTDQVERYISGEDVSYFTQLTVYASDAGANDCSLEAAQRVANCPDLARAFGSVFVDPNVVVCEPFEFEPVGDGSFATTLTGLINAAGTQVNLEIAIVAFRRGNVTAVVGNAAASDPSVDNLRRYVQLVHDRIGEQQ